jgi:hypothetical protein
VNSVPPLVTHVLKGMRQFSLSHMQLCCMLPWELRWSLKEQANGYGSDNNVKHLEQALSHPGLPGVLNRWFRIDDLGASANVILVMTVLFE